MGLEIELAALLFLCALSTSIFDKFEVETAAWRKLLRWMLAAALTLGTAPFIGHWALAVLLGFAALGASAHFIWCKRNGIDPLSAEPRRRYYELRGWAWPDEREDGFFTGNGMVTRRWTTGLRADGVDAYEQFSREISLPMFQQFEGLVAVFMSRTDTNASVYTIWRDRRSVEHAEASALYRDTVKSIIAADVLTPPQSTTVEDLHLIWSRKPL